MPASPSAPAAPRRALPAAGVGLDQHVEIETPELVPVSFAIAGIGSRMAAALLDTLLAGVLILVVDLVGASAGAALSFGGRDGATLPWVTALMVLLQFVLFWGYHVLFETFADGQTPGKRWRGLRVVQDGGFSVTFGVSAVRNLLRAVDAQPGFVYLVGITSAIVSPRGKRLGDLVAGTIVVQERLAPLAPRQAEAPAPPPSTLRATARATLLDDEAYALLDRFLARRAALDPARATALARQLHARLAPALAAHAREGDRERDREHEGERERDDTVDGGATAARNTDMLAALTALRDREAAARAAGATVASAMGARRERHALVAQASERWAEFAVRVAAARRRGLAAQGEDAVSAFAADYREVAADLARLRTATAGRPADESFRLGRLVADAHNLLYRRDRTVLREALTYVAYTLPREIRLAARPILLAALLMFGPAAISWTVVQRDPKVAEQFIPAAMRQRAEEGVERARHRTGYVQDPGLWRPKMASDIIANNVQVTFGAFALGITAGLGTVAILVVNGVSIGGVMGLYASKGILPLILAFVAPHGVLELSAIAIAGGAGLLLGAAILLPGERTRRDALVENGRRAIRLVVAATLMLLVAGALEGLVSPIPHWPLGAKLAVSGATALAFAAWLSLGGPAGRGSRRR